jgi:hypothetical protein
MFCPDRKRQPRSLDAAERALRAIFTSKELPRRHNSSNISEIKSKHPIQ